MKYEGKLYRPPSEAYSLIIQATIGCSHNRCTFCSMYKDKKFRIRNTDEIIKDLVEGRQSHRYVKRIFLADGDALIIETKDLIKILKSIQELFPECERVGAYGSPKSILNKTREELNKLKSFGLGILYLGLESGSDKILEKINKGVKSKDMVEASRKVVGAGIELSVTLISGIGGKQYSKIHALESANILNQMNPNYIGLLTLLIEKETQLHKEIQQGKFQLLTPKEVLEETRILVEGLEIDDCIFRSNHASNYISLRGTLMEDKELILKQIDESMIIDDLESKEIFRRL